MRSTIRKACRCLIALVILGVVPNSASADDAAKPKLSFDSTEYNFGAVSEGSKVAHDFTVTNKGSGDLTIQRLVPACGCTATSSSAEVVRPGGTATIHVDFDTTGFSGEKVKLVRVYTNDLDNPSSSLTLKGTIESDVVVQPASVFLGDIVRGKTTDVPMKEVVVTTRGSEKRSLGAVKTYSKYIQIKELESQAGKKRLQVSIDPKAPLGELRDRVSVEVSSGGGAELINIPVFASVKGNLLLEPSTISFGIVEGTEPIKRSIKLENRGADKIRIENIKSSDSAITANAKTIEDGKIFVLEVSLDPKMVKNDLRASLDVLTSNKTEPPLTLNIYGVTPPKS